MPDDVDPSARTPFPPGGAAWPELEARLDELGRDAIDWRAGRTPLYIFKATDEAYEIGQRAFMKFFSENALGGKRAFFGLRKMEQELVDFGLDLFHAPAAAGGAVTTGGSESIILAVKAARDRIRSRGGVEGPFNIVAPFSAHPAFNKAGDLMDIEVRRLPLGDDLRADVAALASAIDASTIMLVGSAPCFPHGVVDPIDRLSELAVDRGIWLHIDACVGGYVLPFMQRIGRPVPDFDMSLAGVSSISADLHKFGFCPKPISTLFIRDAEDLDRVTFRFEGWPNGLFSTVTLAGTRAGGAVAGAWAVVNHLGISGYTDVARDLATMTDRYVAGIEAIEGLHMLARPHATIINFSARDIDIFSVAEKMSQHGWLPGLTQEPRGMHAMMSMFHAPACSQYLEDLAAAVNQVRGDNAGPSTLKATY